MSLGHGGAGRVGPRCLMRWGAAAGVLSSFVVGVAPQGTGVNAKGASGRRLTVSEAVVPLSRRATVSFGKGQLTFLPSSDNKVRIGGWLAYPTPTRPHVWLS